MVRTLNILVIIILFFNSCKTSKEVLQSVSNSSSNLKLNGYYYTIRKTYSSNFLVGIYFLYQNGVIYYQGTKEYLKEIDITDSVEAQNEYNTRLIKSKGSDKNNYGFWGIYKISNDSITIEKQELGPGKRILRQTGKILNDSTFSLIFYKELDTREKYQKWDKPESYYFKSSTLKPDSTNDFIR